MESRITGEPEVEAKPDLPLAEKRRSATLQRRKSAEEKVLEREEKIKSNVNEGSIRLEKLPKKNSREKVISPRFFVRPGTPALAEEKIIEEKITEEKKIPTPTT